MSKQYVLVVDEVGLEALNAFIKTGSIQYLELQGLNLNAENKYNLLVTPVLPPVNPATLSPPPPAPVDEVPVAEAAANA